MNLNYMEGVPHWMTEEMQGNPQNYQEHYKSINTIFKKYREEGGEARRGFLDYQIDREEWAHAPLPRPGPVDPRRYHIKKPWKPARYKRDYNESTWPPFVMEDPDLYDPDYRDRIRKRIRRAKEYFETLPPQTILYTKMIGYGANGIALKFRQFDPPRDLVIKIGRRGWFSTVIRRELSHLMELADAAHCVQMITRDPVVDENPDPYEFEPIDLYDSSDGSVNSFPDSQEIIVDQDPQYQPEQPSRRELFQNFPEAMEARRLAHQAVIGAREDQIENMLAEAVPWDVNPVNRHDYIILEYMDNGNLSHLIQRIEKSYIAQEQKRVPNRVLWSFWLCLVRSIVALEYPPRMFHPGRHKWHNEAVQNYANEEMEVDNPEGAPDWMGHDHDLFEEVPSIFKRHAGRRLVHFDIDPKNVLIGGLDEEPLDGEHAIIPRLKLADFGRTSRIKPNKRKFTGKYGFYAPEQFGIEWEYLNVNDQGGWEISEQNVAGNYGSHTNVWGIGLTLWTLMTVHRPPMPPQQSQENPLHYAALLMDSPELSYIDRDLREIITQCMRHKPEERPELNALMAMAKEGAKRQYEGETDEVIKEWVKTLSVQRAIYDAVLPDHAPEPDPDDPYPYEHPPPPTPSPPQLPAGLIKKLPAGNQNWNADENVDADGDIVMEGGVIQPPNPIDWLTPEPKMPVKIPQGRPRRNFAQRLLRRIRGSSPPGRGGVQPRRRRRDYIADGVRNLFNRRRR
ncbi:kinase-like domain-containing protein [Daldinia sp. FL1419]|nr:kinase-like domain-containing protein [Daldinia sp. FL1419]